MWTIYQRELAAYFSSPIAYLVAAGFLLFTGIAFNQGIAFAITTAPLDPALIPRLLTLVMILVAPLLTMRLLAEESREGTMELLLTAPINDFAIVVGKFLSAWTFFTFLLLLTVFYQFIVATMTPFVDFSHTFGAYVGIWLYGGATLAVGLLFSALTESQVLSAFLSLMTLLILYYGESVGQIVANVDVAAIIFNLTLQGHFVPSFAEGVIRAEDIVYYAGVIIVMLYITIRLVEQRRWR
jgi:ABC-2 type transport system permease protein